MTEKGKWAVIQQGMSLQDRTARRYHWLSETASNLIVEPHNAIVCDVKRERALNMTADESEACRRTSVDLAKEPPEKTMRLMVPMKPADQARALHVSNDRDRGSTLGYLLHSALR